MIKKLELVDFSWHESNQDGLQRVVQLTLADRFQGSQTMRSIKTSSTAVYPLLIYIFLMTVSSEEDSPVFHFALFTVL